jgi:hypothetical protein
VEARRRSPKPTVVTSRKHTQLCCSNSTIVSNQTCVNGPIQGLEHQGLSTCAEQAIVSSHTSCGQRYGNDHKSVNSGT